MGCNWLHGEMLTSAPGGKDDVDAYLAGRELPSVKAEQQERIQTLLMAGGEMR